MSKLELNELNRQVDGNHYKGFGIEPMEYIIANDLNFLQGNVIKYMARYKLKGGLTDLRKAEHYLAIIIELEEQKNSNES